MNRRKFNTIATLFFAGYFLPSNILYAKTYLTIEQARQMIWGDTPMSAVDVELTKKQIKSIKAASKIRVRKNKMHAWKTDSGGWFIIDNVLGKHEYIDIAVGLDNKGGLKGIEILVYRETYGDQVRNKNWLKQFHGRDYKQHLKLDHQIRNISGATLSCRHVTDGVNRLTHTWNQVLRHL